MSENVSAADWIRERLSPRNSGVVGRSERLRRVREDSAPGPVAPRRIPTCPVGGRVAVEWCPTAPSNSVARGRVARDDSSYRAPMEKSGPTTRRSILSRRRSAYRRPDAAHLDAARVLLLSLDRILRQRGRVCPSRFTPGAHSSTAAAFAAGGVTMARIRTFRRLSRGCYLSQDGEQP